MQVGQKEQNEEVRQDAMKRAERILIEDFVYSPIYYQKQSLSRTQRCQEGIKICRSASRSV